MSSVHQYKFHDDLNIHKIHLDVIETLESMLKEKDEIKCTYDRYKIIADKSHNVNDRDQAVAIIKKYDTYIGSLVNGTIVEEYKSRVSGLLHEYDILSPKTRVFGMDKCINIPKRVTIITRYMHVLESYIDVEWECSYNMSRICTACFKHTKKVGSIMQCRSCGHTQIATPTIDGSAGANQQKESTYKPRKNYDKEYRHVCGLIHNSSSDQVADIESYLYRSGIHEPTREDVRRAISPCGYDNYNDTNWIYAQVTSKELPPISEYTDITGDRFEMYYRTFKNASVEGRNVTNIHFLIRLFLWQEGIEFEEEWFSSLSERTLAKHRRNAQIICSILQEEHPDMNWRYPTSGEISNESVL